LSSGENFACLHRAMPQTSRTDEKFKAKQEKQRKKQAIADATGLRVLAAVSEAVPARLLKRGLLFPAREAHTAAWHREEARQGGIAKTLAPLCANG